MLSTYSYGSHKPLAHLVSHQKSKQLFGLYQFGLPTSYFSVRTHHRGAFTAQQMKFSTADFFSKCDQIRRKLQIWSHLLKKSVMENFIFCAVLVAQLGVSTDLKDPYLRTTSSLLIFHKHNHLTLKYISKNI